MVSCGSALLRSTPQCIIQVARFRPRMAICTYHMEDDPVAVPEVALNIQPDYSVHAKELDVNHEDTRPKILFFN